MYRHSPYTLLQTVGFWAMSLLEAISVVYRITDSNLQSHIGLIRPSPSPSSNRNLLRYPPLLYSFGYPRSLVSFSLFPSKYIDKEFSWRLLFDPKLFNPLMLQQLMVLPLQGLLPNPLFSSLLHFLFLSILYYLFQSFKLSPTQFFLPTWYFAHPSFVVEKISTIPLSLSWFSATHWLSFPCWLVNRSLQHFSTRLPRVAESFCCCSCLPRLFLP